MSIKDYITYSIEPFTKKSILLASLISSFVGSCLNWFGGVFIEEWIGISIPLFVIYFILSLFDMATGLLSNVVKNEQPFKSEIFIKKIFIVCLVLISLGLTTNLEVYTNIDLLKPIFEVLRIFLYVGFVIWEFTSIRENSQKLKWFSVVEVIDLILLPLEGLKGILHDKLNK